MAAPPCYMQRMAIGADKTLPARIKATVTIDGPADEILALVQHLRAGGKRRAQLTVELAGKAYTSPFHVLPAIEGGNIQAALEKIEVMSRQTVLDDETDRRLDRLIRDFGEFTR